MDKILLLLSIMFVSFFIMFVVSTTMYSMDQEPIKGSSEYTNFFPDVTDIRILCMVVGLLGAIMTSTILYFFICDLNYNVKDMDR